MSALRVALNSKIVPAREIKWVTEIELMNTDLYLTLEYILTHLNRKIILFSYTGGEVERRKVAAQESNLCFFSISIPIIQRRSFRYISFPHREELQEETRREIKTKVGRREASI